jgi:hypothetical protein
MNWLAENALPIWVGGAIALTMAFIVYFQTRANAALLGMLAVILVTAGLLLTERYVETPREAVERSLYELADCVENNDVAGALAFLSPNLAPNGKELRKDIESLMPQVRIEVANVVGAPEIEMAEDDRRATVKCRGIIVAVNRRDGMKGGGDARLVMEWVREGERWLVHDFLQDKNWSGGVRSRARGSRGQPGS